MEKCKKNSEREHVTPYIWNHPEIFKLGNFENQKDLSNYRLTVDEDEDFKLIESLINHFQERWENITMDEIIEFLDNNKKIKEINSKYKRNEGYKED